LQNSRSRPCALLLLVQGTPSGFDVERNDFRFDAILMFVRLCTLGLGRPNARPGICGDLTGHGGTNPRGEAVQPRG
jgi:hypothetical protein